MKNGNKKEKDSPSVRYEKGPVGYMRDRVSLTSWRQVGRPNTAWIAAWTMSVSRATSTVVPNVCVAPKAAS